MLWRLRTFHIWGLPKTGKSIRGGKYGQCKDPGPLTSSPLSAPLPGPPSSLSFKEGAHLALPRQGAAQRGWLTSITAAPCVPPAAFAVGLPQSGEPALAVLALDGLAGVEQVLLFIAEHAPVALQALTAVGERIDGQAGAVHAPRVEEGRRMGMRQAEGQERREDDGGNGKEKALQG